MRVVLLGGAPGVGKSTVAKCLLDLAATRSELLQWVDVDALWLHQPWRVNDRTKTMLHANLRAIVANAHEAGVEVLLITWVFQSVEMHHVITALLPGDAVVLSVQLHASFDTWVRRFESDISRPAVNDFFRDRYAAAQATSTDHVVDTDDVDAGEVARIVARLVGW
jgi:hypothetical protein